MRASELIKWWWLIAANVASSQRIRRRQVQAPSDLCTCPADGPVTTTIIQYAITTSYTTVDTDLGVLYSTGPTSTQVTTVTNAPTVTVTTGTTTINEPGVTQTTTAVTTITSTITASTTITACGTISAVPKFKRQNSDTISDSITATDPTGSAPSVLYTAFTNGSTGGNTDMCVCVRATQTTSSCSCPATTTATVTVSSVSTQVSLITILNPTSTVVTITPSVLSTFTIQNTITSGILATVQATPNPFTITQQSTSTVYTTVTSTFTVNSCSTTSTSSVSSVSSTTTSTSTSSVSSVSSSKTSTSTSSVSSISSTTTSTTTSTSTSSVSSVSSTTTSTSNSSVSTVSPTTLSTRATATSSSSTVSSAVGPTSSAAGSLPCNSTAYYVQTVNSVVSFYNIDLKTGATIIVNKNLGNGAYTNINGMGLNPLDNFLYAIATVSTGTYAVVKISVSSQITELLRISSATVPGTVGDIDTNGQFWFSGSGTSWYQVDLYPNSATYGTLIASGTMTLTGYTVLDWSYLPGQGQYLWTISASTDATPTIGLLRWSMTAHTWSVYQAYPTFQAAGSVIGTWGSNNATIWGFSSTSGTIIQLSVGGTPFKLSTGPTGISNGDGARCALAVT